MCVRPLPITTDLKDYSCLIGYCAGLPEGWKRKGGGRREEVGRKGDRETERRKEGGRKGGRREG